MTAGESIAGAVSTPRRRTADAAALARRWVRVALVVLLVVVVVLVAAGGWAAHRLYAQANHRYLDEAAPVFAATQDVLVQMLNEETAVRGYLVSRDPSTLAPYRQGRRREAADLAAIAANAASDPRIPSQLAAVRREVRALDRYFEREVALVRSGPAGQRRAQGRLLVEKSHFDRFRALALELEADAGRVVTRAQHEQHGTFVRTLFFLVGLGLVALALTGALLLLVPPRLFRLYRGEQEARRAAEEGADASRALTHVREGVVLLDEADRVRYVNPAATELFGVAAAEAVGRPLRAVAPALDGLLGTARERPGPVAAELQGRERWIAVAESEFDGGRVVVLRDVSEDHELERVRSEFVATAAHELRTPLAAVFGAVRTIRREDVELPADSRRQLLAMIESETERLRLIMDQLLVSAQLDRRRVEVGSEPFDVGELLADLVASAELRRPSRIELRFDPPSAPVTVVGDRERLRQVVANLVDNAIKYSPDGGVVELRAAAGRRRASIEVADEGLGIPPAEHERIFEKFYRLDPTMTNGVGGSGLGLYISRELVRIMGGRLTVKSAPGRGSIFTVSLPAA